MHLAFMPEHTLTGNIQEHRGFRSKILGNRRDVLVYLPRGYRRFSRTRYPVLYLQDGQNVFDAATAFAQVEWGVDETAQRLIRQNLIEPLIVVAIANIGDERIHEYAPTRGVIDSSGKRKKRSKALARDYGRFLIDELKPYIDRKYRTKREGEFTGLGGSSLGGSAVTNGTPDPAGHDVATAENKNPYRSDFAREASASSISIPVG